ncbi:MAG: glycosyltransferase family 39 protein [Planctomycetaceae bacterium]|jgi:hypothetical protein|nr:glycosyltransferase family 39 protein [Planctomycetaceae bacterium]
MRRIVILLLTVHAFMLTWSAWKHSPLVDEPAHLASGLSHWRRFSFDLYRVNPPLVRSVAAIPLLFIPHKMDWNSYSENPYKRAEFQVGTDLLNQNAKSYHFLLFLSRLFCLPFSLLGGWICYCWGRDLFGKAAGLTALVLWCFSPMILAFGYTIMPDVACASLGITACYFFWKWLKNPCWNQSLLAGVLLGIAELAKFTLLVFYPLWLIAWIVAVVSQRKTITRASLFSQSKQLISIFAVSAFVINMAYGFEGSLTPLKNYEFVSRTLCGDTKWNRDKGFTITGNRFRRSLWGEIPVPLPINYMMGIDVQKKDFELGQPSYFWGEWRNNGWFLYYILGLLIKEPFGFWLLWIVSWGTIIFSKKFFSDAISELILILPVLVILLLVSSQTKLNHHLRYAIPVLPFLFLECSRLAMAFRYHLRIFSIVIIGLSTWSILSSLSFYPHSQGHFNCFIGSAENGSQYLLGSNVDWGQNMLYLSDWSRKHPNASPLKSYYETPYTNEHLNLPDHFIDYRSKPSQGPESGWFAIGVNELHGKSKQYEWLKQFKPVDMIGYSIYIYSIALKDANRVRREMSLPEIEETMNK